MNTAVSIIMIIGVFSFAISGALTAMQKRFDIFGIIIIGFATAVGGGTIRDLLIGKPIFWLVEPTYIYFIIGGSIFAMIFRRKLSYLSKALLFFDTVGLGLFTIMGVEIGLAFELSDVSSIVMGVITGSFGGILRDVLVNDVPVVFRKEIYATISIAGGSIFLILRKFEINEYIIDYLPVFFIIILRFIVIRYKISLPNMYKKDDIGQEEE